MPRNVGQATQEEIELAAIHECGHSLMSECFGLRVYQVMISRDAGGFSEADMPTSPTIDIQITLGGYIAECIYKGIEPSFPHMCEDGSCGNDVDTVVTLALDGRIKPELAIPRAVQEVYTYLTIPSVSRRLRRLAARLSRTRRLDGHIFNKGE